MKKFNKRERYKIYKELLTDIDEGMYSQHFFCHFFLKKVYNDIAPTGDDKRNQQLMIQSFPELDVVKPTRFKYAWFNGSNNFDNNQRIMLILLAMEVNK